ncbi:MAG: C4-dicarboxylate TRAP transporter substrate-binding protein [Alkaliphilus sp.]
MKKLSLVLVLMLLLTAVVTGCGDKDEAPADVAGENVEDFSIKIQLSHVFSPKDQLAIEMANAADIIRERTDGAVDIQVFDSGQLPVYKEGLEQVVRGANFISVEDPSYVGDYVPDFVALIGPMLYESYEEYAKMMETALVAELKAKAAEEGIKILTLEVMFGFRNMITDREIVTPEDMEGMLIRVPNSQLWIETLGAMGATANPLPWNEAVPALRQKVVHGIEGSATTMLHHKIYEMLGHVSMTKHFLGTAGVYISTDVFYSMPEKYQKIVQEEFVAAARRNNEILIANNEDVVNQLKEKGVKFNEVDSDAFRARTSVVFETFEGLTPGIYDRIMEELNVIRGN